MTQGKIYRGRDGHGRQKRKGWEVGILKGWEVGEIGGNCATMVNILRSKSSLMGARQEVEKRGENLYIKEPVRCFNLCFLVFFLFIQQS